MDVSLEGTLTVNGVVEQGDLHKRRGRRGQGGGGNGSAERVAEVRNSYYC